MAERGSMRYTFHGGGPCDGALNGAVMPDPLSSGSAGQPLSAQAFAMRATTRRLGHPSCVTLDHHVRVADRDRDRTARISRDVAPLACTRAGLEPERAVHPDRTDRRHVRAAVLVDGHNQVVRVLLRVRCRRRTRIELRHNGGPIHRREPVRVSQIDGLHLPNVTAYCPPAGPDREERQAPCWCWVGEPAGVLSPSGYSSARVRRLTRGLTPDAAKWGTLRPSFGQPIRHRGGVRGARHQGRWRRPAPPGSRVKSGFMTGQPTGSLARRRVRTDHDCARLARTSRPTTVLCRADRA